MRLGFIFSWVYVYIDVVIGVIFWGYLDGEFRILLIMVFGIGKFEIDWSIG